MDWTDIVRKRKGEPMLNEVYRLRRDHYMQDAEADHPLEEPLVVQVIYDRRYGNPSICLNEMLNRMKDEVLRRTDE